MNKSLKDFLNLLPWSNPKHLCKVQSKHRANYTLPWVPARTRDNKGLLPLSDYKCLWVFWGLTNFCSILLIYCKCVF